MATMMVGTISGAMKLPSAQSRPAKRAAAQAVGRQPAQQQRRDRRDQPPRSVEVHIASIQRGLPKKASYQRSEKPGGGKVSALAEEKDIGITIRIGTARNTSAEHADRRQQAPRPGRAADHAEALRSSRR